MNWTLPKPVLQRQSAMTEGPTIVFPMYQDIRPRPIRNNSSWNRSKYAQWVDSELEKRNSREAEEADDPEKNRETFLYPIEWDQTITDVEYPSYRTEYYQWVDRELEMRSVKTVEERENPEKNRETFLYPIEWDQLLTNSIV